MQQPFSTMRVFTKASGTDHYQQIAPSSATVYPLSHGLLDVRVPPRAPDLIGSWSLGAVVSALNAISDEKRDLKNEVFTTPAASALATSNRGSRNEGSAVRLPPARVGGAMKLTPRGPPAPLLKEAQGVWGFSARVTPVFPSKFGKANPGLRRRFKEFTAVVWGEQGPAQAVNAELIRFAFLIS